MKKLILFLLLPLWVMAQTSNGGETEFDYGIKNNSTQTITTPPYLTTTGMDGTQGKIPSALLEKTDNKQNSLAVDGTGTKYPTVDAVNAALPKTYTTTVYVNTNDPNIATIFDDENPPTVNDDGLKSNTDNLYIGADASAWVYNGATYVTKIIASSSNFYIRRTTVDAGNGKTENIERIGGIKTSQTLDAANVNTGGLLANSIVSNGEIVSKKAGSDTVNLGSSLRLSNNSGSENNQFQLNASNGVDLWNYSSGIWNKRFTFSSDGYLTATNGTLIGGTGTDNYIPKFTSANSIGNSIAYFNGDGLTIREPNPHAYSSFTLKNDDNTSGIQFGVYNTLHANANKGFIYGASTLSELGFYVGAAGKILTIMGNGNLLVNTPTDNGVDKLQVNGSISATALTLSTTPTTSSGTYDFVTRNTTTGKVEKVSSNTIATTASPTFTGTPTAPTAAVGTSDLTIANTAFVQAAVTTTDAGNVKLTGSQTIIGTKTFGNNAFLINNPSGTFACSFFPGNTTGARAYSFPDQSGTVAMTSNNTPISATLLKTTVYTVSTLPNPPSTGQGTYATVSDATAPTYLGTLTGGGSVVCPVFYNGTAWVAH